MKVGEAEPAARLPRRRRTDGSSRGCRSTIELTTRRIDEYDFSHASLGLYEFFYNEFCDWYLELVKPRLYEEEGRSGPVSSTCCSCLSRRWR